MTPLDHLLLLSAFNVVAMLVFGHTRPAGWNAVVLYGAQLLGLLLMAGLGYGTVQVVESSFSITVLNQELVWRFDALSWFFALITIVNHYLTADTKMVSLIIA